jgi:hypothetical protein
LYDRTLFPENFNRIFSFLLGISAPIGEYEVSGAIMDHPKCNCAAQPAEPPNEQITSVRLEQVAFWFGWDDL